MKIFEWNDIFSCHCSSRIIEAVRASARRLYFWAVMGMLMNTPVDSALPYVKRWVHGFSVHWLVYAMALLSCLHLQRGFKMVSYRCNFTMDDASRLVRCYLDMVSVFMILFNMEAAEYKRSICQIGYMLEISERYRSDRDRFSMVWAGSGRERHQGLMLFAHHLILFRSYRCQSRQHWDDSDLTDID